MASGAIKGITIKLGADASALSTALLETEKSLKSAQKELRQVTSALKFNPGNVDLLKQKMTLLQRQVSDNKKYIEDLKTALAQMRAKGIDETSSDFRELQREIIKAESKDQQFNAQLNQTRSELESASSGARKLGSALGSVNASRATEQLNTLKIAAGNLIANGISRLTNAISNNLGNAMSRSDSLANFPAVLEGMGISTEKSARAVEKLSDGIDGLPTTLDSATNGVKQFTAVNGDVNKSTDYFLALNNAIAAGGASTDIQATALEQLSQAYAKGKMDMEEWRALQTAMPAQLKQVATAMGMTTTQLGEGLRNGSVSMDSFMTKIVDLNQTGGKGFMSFAEQAKGATGGLQTSLSTMSTAITSGTQKVLDAIGRDTITGALGRIKEAIKGFFNAVVRVVTFIRSNSKIFTPIAAALASFAGVILTVVAAMKVWAAVQAALNIVMAMNPVLLIVAGIVALVAAITIAYKKSATFRGIVNALGAAFKAVGSVFRAIGSTIATVITNIARKFTSIGTTVKAVCSKIVGFFKALPGSLASIGMDIVKGIGNGITSGIGWIKSRITEFVGNVKSFIKKLFGINSPSKWAAETIGLGIDEGIAKGILDNRKLINSASTGMLGAINPSTKSIASDMANAVGTGLALSQTGGSQTAQITINLGGAKVAEQIFKLNKQGKMALQG